MVVELLLDGSGSGVEDSTVAVFVMESTAVEFTVPRIKMGSVEPVGNVPKGRIPGHGLNVTPPSVENSGFTTSLGIKSVSVTFSASFGPAFDTVNVYVSSSPATTGVGLAIFTTEISAANLTEAKEVSVLLLKFGSNELVCTVAVFCITPVAVAATVPCIKMGSEKPGGSVPRGKIPGQGWKVLPPSRLYSGFKISGGILSTKMTSRASSGPSLITFIE
nr:hypothetical protein [Bacillus sp. SH5-2]